mmetsp:Transcript_84995/g.147464  ORF Transcript_84995/g.147464 Transcript_84995/m.147464 type:complete len:289 (+) Transcript_84995:52-918(+)
MVGIRFFTKLLVSHSSGASSIRNGRSAAAAADSRRAGSISRSPCNKERKLQCRRQTRSHKGSSSCTRAIASLLGAQRGQASLPSASKTRPSGTALLAVAFNAIEGGIAAPKICSIMARCSISSWTLKSLSPRYSIAMMQPAPQMSESSSQGRPSTTSGALNCLVPMRPSCLSSLKTAPPKSITTMRQSCNLCVSAPRTRGCGLTSKRPSRNMTFRHFRSVCVRPIECMKLRLCKSCFVICLASDTKRPWLSFAFRKSRRLMANGSKTKQKLYFPCKKVSCNKTHKLRR